MEQSMETTIVFKILGGAREYGFPEPAGYYPKPFWDPFPHSLLTTSELQAWGP